MNPNAFTRLAVTLAASSLGVLLAGSALAQPRFDAGKREFDDNCAACHGKDGRGAGSITDLLKKSPPDLSLLSRRNGGVFPLARVYEVVEGAGPGHGTREMPAWGQAFGQQAAEYYVDMPYNSEGYVRARILALVEYVNRLQMK